MGWVGSISYWVGLGWITKNGPTSMSGPRMSDLVCGWRDGRSADVRRRRTRRPAVIDRYFVIHHRSAFDAAVNLIVLSR